MNKESLIATLKDMKKYSWSLYFLKIDRRKNNPYTAFKIRFKNDKYLSDYVQTLGDMIVNYHQLYKYMYC